MTTIALPARCDRAAALALYPELVAALGGDALRIDASKAEQVGASMLQLLASARRSFDALQIDASDALIETARLCGLHDTLFDEAA